MGNEEDLLDHLDAVARDQRPPKSPEADASALYCLRMTPEEEEDQAEKEREEGQEGGQEEGGGPKEAPEEVTQNIIPIIKAYHKPVCISNGIAWSSDNQTMFFIDSCQRKIFAFDYDIELGTLSEWQFY